MGPPPGLSLKSRRKVADTVCSGVVFPWATPLLPFDDVQVEAGTGQDDSNSVTPGGSADPDAGAPDEIPYSTTSHHPEPSPSR